MKTEARQLLMELANQPPAWLRNEDWEILKPLLDEWSAKTGAVLHEPVIRYDTPIFRGAAA